MFWIQVLEQIQAKELSSVLVSVLSTDFVSSDCSAIEGLEGTVPYT